MPRYLIIPGWAGSGPDHWQSHLERDLANSSRVEMPDWLEPRRADWLETLDRAVRSSREPSILVAHSLGCMAVAHWAASSTLRVRGALLVAPADLDREHCPAYLREFAPVPRGRLRFSSRVVASDNDPYATLAWVTQLATDWGSDLTVLDKAGHINRDSGYGRWPEGRTLLRPFDEDPHHDEARPSSRQGYEVDGDGPPWIHRGMD
jgi:predicted alpha/beta hydrolase family esterase